MTLQHVINTQNCQKIFKKYYLYFEDFLAIMSIYGLLLYSIVGMIFFVIVTVAKTLLTVNVSFIKKYI